MRDNLRRTTKTPRQFRPVIVGTPTRTVNLRSLLPPIAAVVQRYFEFDRTTLRHDEVLFHQRPLLGFLVPKTGSNTQHNERNIAICRSN